MTKPVRSPRQPRFSARERLRWQRAIDEQLIDAIFGVVRDVPVPSPEVLAQISAAATGDARR